MSRYLVLRSPSMPEDEGRTETFGPFPTQAEAQAIVDKMAAGGYFSRAGFRIIDVNAEAERNDINRSN